MNRKGSRSKLLGLIIRAALGLGLLGLAIHMNRAEIQGVLSRKPDPWGFAIGLLYYLGGLFFAWLRWYMLVRAAGMAFRYRDAVRLGFIAALFNFVIPGAVFGNVVKAAFLCRERPEDKPKAIASVLVDFLCGLIGLFLIAAVVGTIGRDQLPSRVQKLVIAAWVAVGFSTLALVSAFRPRKSRRKKKVGAGIYRGRLDLVAIAILMGTGTHALNVMAFHSISVAMFGASNVPNLASHFLIVPLVLFTTAVPLPFGALGVSEQASQGLFGLTNYHGGAVAMLGFRVVMLIGAGIGAAVYVMNAHEVRELAKAEELESETDAAESSPVPATE